MPPSPHPQALDKMEKEWSTILFNVMPYKETDTYILKSPDEASQLLDDHIVMTQSMSFSPYKKPFEQRINSWETKLKLTQVGLPALSSPTLPVPCPKVAPYGGAGSSEVPLPSSWLSDRPLSQRRGTRMGLSISEVGLLELAVQKMGVGPEFGPKLPWKRSTRAAPRPLSAAWAWDSEDLQAWGSLGWTPQGLGLLSVPSHSSLSFLLPLLSHNPGVRVPGHWRSLFFRALEARGYLQSPEIIPGPGLLV